MTPLKRLNRFDEFSFRFIPTTGQSEQTAIGGATIGGKEGTLLLLGIIGGHLAPLFGPHQIARQFPSG